METQSIPKKIKWIKRRGAKRVLVGGLMIFLVVLLVGTSFFWTPYDPNKSNLALRLKGPSAAHPFGTDNLGRDILSRVMAGGKISLTIAFLTVIGTTLLGVVAGVLSGYYGGALDATLNMVAEMRQSMPMTLIVIVFLAVFGSSIVSMTIILALAEWISIFRTVRARTMTEKKSDYVTAAYASGASNFRIIFKYILPNVLPSVIVLSSLLVGSVILEESSLSYLGIGVSKPYPTWGRMVGDGQSYLISGKWWLSIFSALPILLLVLGINILGDGLRQMWKME